jgi:hypothetical protein
MAGRQAYFLPSLGDAPENYPRLVRSLQKRGFSVHGPAFRYDAETSRLADYVALAAELADTEVGPDATLIGHSIGAVVAVLEAQRRQYGRLVVASMTPLGALFRRVASQSGINDSLKTELSAIELDSVATHLNVPLGERHVLLGGRETRYPEMGQMAVYMAHRLDAQLHVVPDGIHELEGSEPYRREVVRVAAT